MTAGLNLRIDVWRITTPTDDVVGGAITTGTVVYSGVEAFMQESPQSMVFSEQGLETLSIFNMTVSPGTLTIYERDEVEVVEPHDHYYHGKRFRVITSRHSSHNPRDPRNYLILTVTRSDRMHQLQ